MYLHESVKESVIRFYDMPDGFATRKPYKTSVTVDYLSPSFVHLSNLSGEMDRKTLEALKAHLKNKGVQIINFERHGIIRTEEL